MISYKYNIYHSKKTKYLDKMLRECCFVWNHALALQRRYHKLFGKYISVGKMKKHFAHMITKQDIQAAASYIFRSSFVSEDQVRKVTVRAGNNATKILVKTFRGKLFKKAFGRARRGKDISSFERQEKESGFNFLHNHNNGRMRSGHIVINGIGMFKQIMKSGT